MQTNWATGSRRVICDVFLVLEWTMQYAGEMLWNQEIVPVFAGKSGGSAMYKIYNLLDNHKSIAKPKCNDRTALFCVKFLDL